jgi:hypothetical protein
MKNITYDNVISNATHPYIRKMEDNTQRILRKAKRNSKNRKAAGHTYI